MAGETTLTVIGNLTADPDVRALPNGDMVCNFTVAATPRVYSKDQGDWIDGDTLFMRCTVWREQAEHIADTFAKGMHVIVHGTIKTRSYEKDGEKRSITELDVLDAGPALRYATAKVTKKEGGGGKQRSQRGQASDGYGQQARTQTGSQQAWGAPNQQTWNPQQGGPTGWGGGDAEPPF